MEKIQIQNIIKKVLTPISYILIGGFVLFEEYIWNKVFKVVYLKIKYLNILIKFKNYLLQENCRYRLLFIFLIPFILMEGLSLISLKLIANGMIAIGVSIYVLKILLTIPVVVIFNTTKKKLLSFRIIYFVFFWILKLKRTQIYRNTKKIAKQIKIFFSIQLLLIKTLFLKFKSNPLFSHN